jgi:hypothetical protein
VDVAEWWIGAIGQFCVFFWWVFHEWPFGHHRLAFLCPFWPLSMAKFWH